MLLRIVCHLNSLAKSLIVNMDEADIKDREDSGAGGGGQACERRKNPRHGFQLRCQACDLRFSLFGEGARRLSGSSRFDSANRKSQAWHHTNELRCQACDLRFSLFASNLDA